MQFKQTFSLFYKFAAGWDNNNVVHRILPVQVLVSHVFYIFRRSIVLFFVEADKPTYRCGSNGCEHAIGRAYGRYFCCGISRLSDAPYMTAAACVSHLQGYCTRFLGRKAIGSINYTQLASVVDTDIVEPCAMIALRRKLENVRHIGLKCSDTVEGKEFRLGTGN